MATLIRPREDRVFAGVCAAVAHRFGCRVLVVRVLAAAGLMFFGVGLWPYLFLWVLIPSE
ncbi:PspC domain-containing protein [Microbacterium elymi]|uniref:PspC domain-containing protein n=1 Tax=Microbacterium elymi TaxID=2909587 RepID=A0ABY5NLH5_9MICO|nr:MULTISPECIES: PspC domain-containing protein [Microbacterium]UUT35964.1 PspC domain-containing protein [Microbacterium elymi]